MTEWALSKYPQVLIDAEGKTADEKLAPLVNMVTKFGIPPRYHSQGNTDTEHFDQAWMSFSSAYAALEFLTQEVTAGHALEIGTIETSLRSIAGDADVMQRVRTRANALLARVPAD